MYHCANNKKICFHCVLIVLHLCNVAWVKAPLSKKRVAAKEREDCKAEQSQHECGGRSEGQRDGGWSEGQVDVYLQKILAGKIELLHDIHI